MSNENNSALSERSIARVAYGLIFGVVLFGATVAFLLAGRFAPVTWSLVEMIPVAVAFGGFMGSSVLPGLVTRRSMRGLRKRGVNLAAPACRGQLLSAYLVQMTLGYALIEGPAFFGLIMSLANNSVVGLVIAGLCLVVMIGHFPSEHKINDWIHAQACREV